MRVESFACIQCVLGVFFAANNNLDAKRLKQIIIVYFVFPIASQKRLDCAQDNISLSLRVATIESFWRLLLGGGGNEKIIMKTQTQQL